jgi:hypothetical protein
MIVVCSCTCWEWCLVEWLQRRRSVRLFCAIIQYYPLYSLEMSWACCHSQKSLGQISYSVDHLLGGWPSSIWYVEYQGSLPVQFLDTLHNTHDFFLWKRVRTGAISEALANVDKDLHCSSKRLFHSHVVVVLFQFCFAEVRTEGRKGFEHFGVLVVNGLRVS